MKNIYLIRHGLTNYNIEGKFQGISDISLNDIGQHQAKQLSTYFQDIDIDEIFISNLKRTYETAKYFANDKGIEPNIVEGLREMNGGYFEGKTDEELLKVYSEQVHNLRNDLPKFMPPNGESSREAYNRISSTILDIVTNSESTNIAIVSHGLVLILFLAYVSNTPFEDIKHIYLENTSVTKLIFDENKFSIEYINDFKHLNNK